MAEATPFRSRHILLAALVMALVVESAWLAYPVVRDIIVPPRENAAQRGRKLAGQLGCFNCHGAGGTVGV